MSFAALFLTILSLAFAGIPQQIEQQRGQSRDTMRIASITQVRTALELYYADQQRYPIGFGLYLGEGDATALSGKGFSLRDASVIPGESRLPIYMMQIPADPGSGTPYRYWSNGKDYVLAFTLEQQTGSYTAGPNMVSSTDSFAIALLDDDHDGLPNTAEGLFGADSKKRDTDGDGYDDATEIQNGYNPNGPGKLRP